MYPGFDTLIKCVVGNRSKDFDEKHYYIGWVVYFKICSLKCLNCISFLERKKAEFFTRVANTLTQILCQQTFFSFDFNYLNNVICKEFALSENKQSLGKR